MMWTIVQAKYSYIFYSEPNKFEDFLAWEASAILDYHIVYCPMAQPDGAVKDFCDKLLNLWAEKEENMHKLNPEIERILNNE